MNPLVTAWLQVSAAFSETVAQVSDDDFAHPLRRCCPGGPSATSSRTSPPSKSNSAASPLPAHEPDWDTLPHADDLFSRYTEIGVDYRRGGRRPEVRARNLVEAFDPCRAVRRPQELDRRVTGGAGSSGRSAGPACGAFDIFLHDLDIRDALTCPHRIRRRVPTWPQG